MVIIANQHGDEFTVSNSALEIIRALSSNAKGAKAIRDELTVTVIPRVNVDGFDATPTGRPWRYNVDPFCSSNCPAFYEDGQGFDINRYHSYLTSDPNDDPNTGPVTVGQGDNPVPEARTVRAAYDAAGGGDEVEVVLDLHHQGTYVDPDGSMVTAATTWPNATGPPTRSASARRSTRTSRPPSGSSRRCSPRRTARATRTSRATPARSRPASRATPTACSAPPRC